MELALEPSIAELAAERFAFVEGDVRELEVASRARCPSQRDRRGRDRFERAATPRLGHRPLENLARLDEGPHRLEGASSGDQRCRSKRGVHACAPRPGTRELGSIVVDGAKSLVHRREADERLKRERGAVSAPGLGQVLNRREHVVGVGRELGESRGRVAPTE